MKVSFLILLSTIILLSSCSNLERDANEKFMAQFESEVARIRSERSVPMEERPQQLQQAKMGEDWRNASDVLGITGTYKYKSAEVDTSGLRVRTYEEYLPNQAVFEEGLKSNFRPKLPDDMFEIYYVKNYPQFKNPGIEFDLIQVPQKDVYGIRTDLGDKEYLLVGNNAIQQNVDLIRGYHTKENNEIAKTLIKEQRARKRQKRINEIFATENEM